MYCQSIWEFYKDTAECLITTAMDEIKLPKPHGADLVKYYS